MDQFWVAFGSTIGRDEDLLALVAFLVGRDEVPIEELRSHDPEWTAYVETRYGVEDGWNRFLGHQGELLVDEERETVRLKRYEEARDPLRPVSTWEGRKVPTPLEEAVEEEAQPTVYGTGAGADAPAEFQRGPETEADEPEEGLLGREEAPDLAGEDGEAQSEPSDSNTAPIGSRTTPSANKKKRKKKKKKKKKAGTNEEAEKADQTLAEPVKAPGSSRSWLNLDDYRVPSVEELLKPATANYGGNAETLDFVSEFRLDAVQYHRAVYNHRLCWLTTPKAPEAIDRTAMPIPIKVFDCVVLVPPFSTPTTKPAPSRLLVAGDMMASFVGKDVNDTSLKDSRAGNMVFNIVIERPLRRKDVTRLGVGTRLKLTDCGVDLLKGFTITIDSVNDVEVVGELESGFCRFCLAADAKARCVRCNALYCGTQCLLADANLLHKGECTAHMIMAKN